MLIHESLDNGELSGITFDILWNLNFWAVTIVSSSFSCLLFLIVRRFDFLFSDTIINSIMQNKFESNFTHKLYKKKLEEIRKFHRSIAKFKKIFKMKNEEFDNLSDKRFKDIVDAYKRNHTIEKKTPANLQENIKHDYLPVIVKRAKSQCFDDLDFKEKRLGIYNKINENNVHNKNDVNETNKRRTKNTIDNTLSTKKKIQFIDVINDNDTNLDNIQNIKFEENKFENEDLPGRKQESIRRYQSLNKNNIHLFDFNSHPSKFFNQN